MAGIGLSNEQCGKLGLSVVEKIAKLIKVDLNYRSLGQWLLQEFREYDKSDYEFIDLEKWQELIVKKRQEFADREGTTVAQDDKDFFDWLRNTVPSKVKNEGPTDFDKLREDLEKATDVVVFFQSDSVSISRYREDSDEEMIWIGDPITIQWSKDRSIDYVELKLAIESLSEKVEASSLETREELIRKLEQASIGTRFITASEANAILKHLKEETDA